MEVKIAKEITELIPAFKIGVIQYDDITVGDSPQMVKGRLQLFQESAYFELEEKKLTDYPGIQEWRQLFKKTGKDPNRYRHSAEALFRRVQKQNYLQPVNSAIDLNNFFSLQYQIPIGIYDKAALKEDITIRLGKELEEYHGINGRANSLHRLIVSADELGAFGSPFVDSIRTVVSEKTTDAIHLIYLQPSLTLDQAEKAVSSLGQMFTQINGGNAIWTIAT